MPGGPFRAVFIRAPAIVETGPDVVRPCTGGRTRRNGRRRRTPGQPAGHRLPPGTHRRPALAPPVPGDGRLSYDAVIVGSGPERIGRGHHPGAGRAAPAGRGAQRDDRRRRPHGRADPAGVPARRLFGHPSPGHCVPLLSHPAAGEVRSGVDPAAGLPRPSPGRRHGCGRHPLGGRDGRGPRPRRRHLPPALRPHRGTVAGGGGGLWSRRCTFPATRCSLGPTPCPA